MFQRTVSLNITFSHIDSRSIFSKDFPNAVTHSSNIKSDLCRRPKRLTLDQSSEIALSILIFFCRCMLTFILNITFYYQTNILVPMKSTWPRIFSHGCYINSFLWRRSGYSFYHYYFLLFFWTVFRFQLEVLHYVRFPSSRATSDRCSPFAKYLQYKAMQPSEAMRYWV